jgi:predicted metalloprotease
LLVTDLARRRGCAKGDLMRWGEARQSTNIQDRRGLGGGGFGRGGMVGGGGLITLLLVLMVSCLTGVNPLELIQGVDQTAPPVETQAPPSGAPADDPQAQFVAAVLGDTEDTWNEIFGERGSEYEEPVLVLFDGAVQSTCGFASAAVGPFYCPNDHKVYLDLSFFRDLDRRFGAPGDFAQAYVIAHEVGHHVQTLLGVSERVHRARQRSSEEGANALAVRMELQADCLAGVWGHHADRRQLLESGDINEGLRAAAAIGDDRLQRQQQGYVVPESFTHGSSEQRASWLRRGLQTGDLNACDTFNTREPF